MMKSQTTEDLFKEIRQKALYVGLWQEKLQPLVGKIVSHGSHGDVMSVSFPLDTESQKMEEYQTLYTNSEYIIRVPLTLRGNFHFYRREGASLLKSDISKFNNSTVYLERTWRWLNSLQIWMGLSENFHTDSRTGLYAE